MKKLLSIILAILMIATTIPFAFAAESDGVKTTLDVSKGYIVIADSYVTWGSETVEVDPDGYIITGTASGDTPLKFINDSGAPITFDLVFDNLSLTAAEWCSVIAIDDNAPVTLNIECKGSNAITSHNHSVFNNAYAFTSITINITKTEDSSITFERQYAPEDGILFTKDDTRTFVYIDGNQFDAAVHGAEGIPDCRGYFCDECGQYFGEKDETKHSGDGVQTCCGYKCEVCEGWYGEAADEEHTDENFDGFCDVSDNFIGKEIKVGDTYTVTKVECVKFVPNVSGTYIISSSEGSDAYVELLDSDFKFIAYSEDDGDDFNFSLEYYYEAGETYYFYFFDYDFVYNYSVIFECKKHQGGTQTCKGYACDACGEWYGEADADNHSFSKYEEVEAPECGKAGLERAACDYGCGATDEQEIPALNHKDTLVQVEAKAKTCTEIGWDAYEYCTECEYTTYVEIPASHEIKTVDKKDATCTEAGHEAYEYCTECEYTTYKEIPSNGHTPLEPVKENEVAPKCGVAGSYDLVVYCDVCDEELDRDTVAVDALTHTDADGDYLCDNGCGHEFEKPVEPDTPDEPTDDTCDHICHSNNTLVKFFWKIISFFFRLFNIQQYCDCGELHYEKSIFG